MTKRGYSPLKQGRYSNDFQHFLKEKGLVTADDVKNIPADTVDAILKKVQVMKDYSATVTALAEWYGNTGKRGLAAFDKLVDLRSRILVREDSLKQEGKDSLEDPMLLQWHKLELELMKFLEKMRFDSAKAQREFELKERDQNIKDLDASAWEDVKTD